ncbi:hypothetical protein PHAVU_008G091500 [Phaseolus vulgaris]|uniref:Pentatricopeptide repeat-containing protein n=1 Tax=Phaseolus vulgaris TaxID=3885 RepID=V7B5R1_PHAVU|nr:hypothetical protein PHAVU_008G091500g [Phaseolus vulgaris]ESW12183.1 hypothetical protein PHAVU_008G091500g [Phaseolus vulgaris]
MFDEMLESGVEPNSVTYSVLIRGVLWERDVEGGRELICRLWEMMSVEAEDSVKTAAFANLVGSLCRIAEELPFGSGLFEEVAYGQMVDSLCRVERHNGAARIVYVMRKRGFVPGEVSYNYVIHGLSRDELLNLLVFMPENQYLTGVISLNTVINGFCKMGRVDEASKVLHDMLMGKFAAPDVVTFTTLIYGMLDAASINEAHDLFHKLMPENGIKPSVVTYNALLREMKKNGLTPDSMTWRILDKLNGKGVKDIHSEDPTMSTFYEPRHEVRIEVN